MRSKIIKAIIITVAAAIAAVIVIIGFIDIKLSAPASISGAIGSPDELAAGTFNPNGGTVLHPYLGFVFDPTQNLNINKFGFWGPDPMDKKSADKLIVGVFGGSVADLYTREEAAKLADKLQTFPEFKGKKIEVFTIAAGGFKQPQQLIALNYLQSLGAEFDVVVNIDGFNEAALPWSENVPHNVSSFFPRSWFFYSRQSLDLQGIALAALLQGHKNQLGRIDDLFSAGLLSKFKLIRDYFYSRALKKISEDNDALAKLLKEKPATFQMTGPEPGHYSQEEIKNNIIQVWKNSSIQMSKIVKTNHGLYLHFLQPNQYLPGSKTLTDQEKKTAYLEDNGYQKGVQTFYPEMIKEGEALKKEGVIFTDLTSLFKNVSDTIYYDTCCHFNQEGNDMLNEKIAETIAGSYKETP